MADAIKAATGQTAALVSGARGELSVWVNGAKVADKADCGLPSLVADKVQTALA